MSPPAPAPGLAPGGVGLAALLAAVVACGRGPAPLDDCGGDLRGVWRDDRGRRWGVIPDRDGWEVYPIFDDGAVAPAPPPGVVAAPSMFDLPRPAGATDELAGVWARRFEHGAAICWQRTPARLHGCRGDRARLDVVPHRPPADLAACDPPPAGPVETWTLTRE